MSYVFVYQRASKGLISLDTVWKVKATNSTNAKFYQFHLTEDDSDALRWTRAIYAISQPVHMINQACHDPARESQFSGYCVVPICSIFDPVVNLINNIGIWAWTTECLPHWLCGEHNSSKRAVKIGIKVRCSLPIQSHLLMVDADFDRWRAIMIICTMGSSLYRELCTMVMLLLC